MRFFVSVKCNYCPVTLNELKGVEREFHERGNCIPRKECNICSLVVRESDFLDHLKTHENSPEGDLRIRRTRHVTARKCERFDECHNYAMRQGTLCQNHAEGTE